MAGRRLLDAAKLYQAVKSVAKQHVALRAQQYDVYTSTSTLAKAAKEQSDRVTLTVRAGVVLAKRLAEDVPAPKDWNNASSYKSSRSTSDPQSDSSARAAEQRTSHVDVDGAIVVEPARSKDRAQSAQEIDARTDIQSAGEPGDVAGEKAGIALGPTAEASLKQEDSLGSAATKNSPSIGDQLEEKPKGLSDQGPAKQQRPEVKDVAQIQALPESTRPEPTTEEEVRHAADAIASEQTPEGTSFEMRESRVPSTRFGRLWQYGGLGMSMAFGAVGESVRRTFGGGSSDGGSLFLSPGNLELLVAKLSRMRGAALKLGQMVSFQDIKMLPPEIHQVLQRVQDSADYMPPSQRDTVLAANLGSDWRDFFSDFEERPIAAASIGQVHKATYRPTGQTVAVKVQYPGVARSIDSDLNNLSILLTASKLLPRGLFLNKTIDNARTELAWECDYIREAECASRFRNLLSDDTSTFTVPEVIHDASGKTVLTAEYMSGKAVTKLPHLSQTERDWIGTNILRLCLREITDFKFMQTDPNWTNFLYNARTHKLELLDFGASRDYPDKFIDPYIGILKAASHNDRDTVYHLSLELGYLTGDESRAMADAHIDSVLTLSEPFGDSAPEVYDFRDQTITDRVRGLIPVMLRERLAPPPEETYSLHRKLSGAFLLCARLGSRVPCRELFRDATGKLQA